MSSPIYASFMRAPALANGNFMAGYGNKLLSFREAPVLDVIFLALTFALFLLGAGYAVLCDRL